MKQLDKNEKIETAALISMRLGCRTGNEKPKILNDGTYLNEDLGFSSLIGVREWEKNSKEDEGYDLYCKIDNIGNSQLFDVKVNCKLGDRCIVRYNIESLRLNEEKIIVIPISKVEFEIGVKNRKNLLVNTSFRNISGKCKYQILEVELYDDKEVVGVVSKGAFYEKAITNPERC